VRPTPHQSCGEPLQLSEFDLQLTFVATRALRKNIQDETDPIDDAGLQRSLEISLLGRREFVIKNDEARPRRDHMIKDFVDLA
jgi:hypothetical protein